MASITIGERSLAIARPADLEDVLLVSTGCTASEQAAMIARTPTPALLARALHPMLIAPDTMDVGSLAGLIASGDAWAIGAQIAELLGPADA